MAGQKIRIKLAAYDHELVDLAAQRIVDAMQKSGAKIGLEGPRRFFSPRALRCILADCRYRTHFVSQLHDDILHD